jgi:hypothetical protein
MERTAETASEMNNNHGHNRCKTILTSSSKRDNLTQSENLLAVEEQRDKAEK